MLSSFLLYFVYFWWRDALKYRNMQAFFLTLLVLFVSWLIWSRSNSYKHELPKNECPDFLSKYGFCRNMYQQKFITERCLLLCYRLMCAMISPITYLEKKLGDMTIGLMAKLKSRGRRPFLIHNWHTYTFS